MAHNTDYKIQKTLTEYAIGTDVKRSLDQEVLHQDPNLNHAASVAVVLTRLPRSDKLTPVETMKLAAGEVAGEKSLKTLAELIDQLNQDTDIGQALRPERDWARETWDGPSSCLLESSETNDGKCMFALDIFHALERIVLDYVQEPADRTKFMEDSENRPGPVPGADHDRDVQRLYG